MLQVAQPVGVQVAIYRPCQLEPSAAGASDQGQRDAQRNITQALPWQGPVGPGRSFLNAPG
jgi:hypothetical protein